MTRQTETPGFIVRVSKLCQIPKPTKLLFKGAIRLEPVNARLLDMMVRSTLFLTYRKINCLGSKIA